LTAGCGESAPIDAVAAPPENRTATPQAALDEQFGTLLNRGEIRSS